MLHYFFTLYKVEHSSTIFEEGDSVFFPLNKKGMTVMLKIQKSRSPSLIFIYCLYFALLLTLNRETIPLPMV